MYLRLQKLSAFQKCASRLHKVIYNHNMSPFGLSFLQPDYSLVSIAHFRAYHLQLKCLQLTMCRADLKLSTNLEDSLLATGQLTI